MPKCCGAASVVGIVAALGRRTLQDRSRDSVLKGLHCLYAGVAQLVGGSLLFTIRTAGTILALGVGRDGLSASRIWL
jgi:hypothetical protein